MLLELQSLLQESQGIRDRIFHIYENALDGHFLLLMIFIMLFLILWIVIFMFIIQNRLIRRKHKMLKEEIRAEINQIMD